ncbi:cation:proton antiporter [uncultured Duncaniella sp.]|uniref:cation:proton antiporter n=1 Tax=uncultured Duncaniella sp. TaxID=2768039 RepID=UPI00265F1855|nr:cation:proton antiporter [uncultured Duncaniella sp.]
MNVESLITDLAFILLLGAFVTVLFKWLKQPVVLGYIVAGFLASPNFTLLPSVNTLENIDFWAEIGIVVLLFSLGLEFSFKKLVNSGVSAIVTALIIVTGMMCAGFIVGYILDFNFINSLFLGGMMSMSSTTIIIKAFTDMGLRQQKFASQVLAVLIVEDLFAVVMMVVLSSIAINDSVEGSEMLMSIGKLVFFLVIWFLVGVYIIPTMLNRWRRFLNSETLLVVSMGMCLGMAVFSVYCGFSLALGAFVMGSILAGTSYAERIEHVTTPVKDLFGSVFFISVGMMVQPDILVKYWLPIIIISAVVIAGMIIFGTFGMLITGQNLRTAIRSGFALTQIGEFAFIIASLGMSLGVLEPTLYPIVVAVSVITTFTTPYFIKMSLPVYDFTEKHLPAKLHFLINRYGEDGEKEQASGVHQWRVVLRKHLWRTLIYAIILLAITITTDMYLRPWLITVIPEWGSLLSVIITLVVMSPFLIALTSPVRVPKDASKGFSHNIPCIVLMFFRSLIALGFIVHAVSLVYSAKVFLLVAVTVVLLIGLLFYRRLNAYMSTMESKFFDNLNERDLRRSGKNNHVVSDLHLAYMTVGNACGFVGEKLMNSNLRRKYGVNIVNIQRGNKTIPIPNGRERLFPGDVIGVIGTDSQLEQLLPNVEVNEQSDAAPATSDMALKSVLLSFNSPLINKTPSSSSLRDNYDVLVVAVNRDGEFIDSNPNLVFSPGDIVWVAGTQANINRLK